MVMASTGRSPRPVGDASTFATTSMPSTISPNTTWRPSSQGVATVQMKNLVKMVRLGREERPGREVDRYFGCNVVRVAPVGIAADDEKATRLLSATRCDAM